MVLLGSYNKLNNWYGTVWYDAFWERWGLGVSVLAPAAKTDCTVPYRTT